MTKPNVFEITTGVLRKGRTQYRMITALSVVRCLSIIKDQTTDPLTKENLQVVIDLIHDSKPTF